MPRLLWKSILLWIDSDELLMSGRLKARTLDPCSDFGLTTSCERQSAILTGASSYSKRVLGDRFVGINRPYPAVWTLASTDEIKLFSRWNNSQSWGGTALELFTEDYPERKQSNWTTEMIVPWKPKSKS